MRIPFLTLLPELDPYDMRTVGWYNFTTAVVLIEISDPDRLSSDDILLTLYENKKRLARLLSRTLPCHWVRVTHRNDLNHSISDVLPKWVAPPEPPSVSPPPQPPPAGPRFSPSENSSNPENFVAYSIYIRTSEFREKRIRQLPSDKLRRTLDEHSAIIHTVFLSEVLTLKQEDLRVARYNATSFVVMVEVSNRTELSAEQVKSVAESTPLITRLHSSLRSAGHHLAIPCPEQVRELRKPDALPPVPLRPPAPKSVCPEWALKFGASTATLAQVFEYQLRIEVPPAARLAGRYTISALAKMSRDFASAGAAPSRLEAAGQLLHARFWSKAGCTGRELFVTLGGWPSEPSVWQRVKASYYALDTAIAPACIEWYVGFPTRTARGAVWVTELQAQAPDGTLLLRDGNFTRGRGMANHISQSSGFLHTTEDDAAYEPELARVDVSSHHCRSRSRSEGQLHDSSY